MLRLLDLFCGAGGATKGYQRVGFYVVGVDLHPQPNYCGDEFHQADALEVLRILVAGGTWQGYRLEDFAVVHASPPCQGYGAATHKLVTRDAPRLIEPVRALLERGRVEYVIENVVGAPLREPVTLCGSMFGLDVKRHRLFETTRFLMAPMCNHGAWTNRYPTHARKDKAQTSPVVHVYGTGGGAGKDLDLWRRVMDVPWMQTKAEIAESIPPAYTEFIGNQLTEGITA